MRWYFSKFCRLVKFQWQIRIAMLSILFFFCARVFVRSLARMLFRSFQCFLARLLLSYIGRTQVFFMPACGFGAFALCDVCRGDLLVTTR